MTNRALVQSSALGHTHCLVVLTAATRGPKGAVLGALVGLAWTGMAMAAGAGGGAAVGASLATVYAVGKVGDALEEAYAQYRQSTISPQGSTRENAVELLKVLLAGATPAIADQAGGAVAAKAMLHASPFIGAVAKNIAKQATGDLLARLTAAPGASEPSGAPACPSQTLASLCGKSVNISS